MPFELLKKYLRLKGINCVHIARCAGCDPSNVQKVLRGYTYPTKNGPKLRRSPLVEQAVADCLDMPLEHVWGPEAQTYLIPAIKDELWQQFISATTTVNQVGAKINV